MVSKPLGGLHCRSWPHHLVSANSPAERLALITIGDAIRACMAVLASVLGSAPRRARFVTLSAFTRGRRRGRAYRNCQERQRGDWALRACSALCRDDH